MQYTLLMIGKTTDAFVKEGLDLYASRFQHYQKLRINTIPELRDKKNLTPEQIKEKESDLILQKLPKQAVKILLDEKGQEYSSLEFATFLQKNMNAGSKEIIFIIGGAFGASISLKKSVDYILSLSKLTFTHQMIRLILMEQLYRAMTILKNESYHNE